MKLLIPHDLTFTDTFPPSLSDDAFDTECEYFQELNEIARKYAIGGSFVVLRTGVTVTIRAQKVTLDEVAMNALFSDFLTELFVVETRYAALGGAGCDFALEVVSAVPRPSNYAELRPVPA